jgi:mannose-6-phosphate isomerase class I
VNEGGKTKKYIIEVKPKKQTNPPVKKSRVTKTYLYEMKTYAVNQAKWKAAQEFCKDNGMQFKIVTEEELYGTRGISRRSKK